MAEVDWYDKISHTIRKSQTWFDIVKYRMEFVQEYEVTMGSTISDALLEIQADEDAATFAAINGIIETTEGLNHNPHNMAVIHS